MNSKIDGGPLIVEKKIKINRDEYVDDVQKKINLLFPKLCLKAINKQLTKAKMTFYPKKQKIFWRQRNKNDSIIDIKNLNCLEIYNRIRASSPKFYPAFIIRKRFKYLLFKAHLKNYKSTHGSKKIIVKNDRLLINCSKKYLLIKSFKRIKRLK